MKLTYEERLLVVEDHKNGDFQKELNLWSSKIKPKSIMWW